MSLQLLEKIVISPERHTKKFFLIEVFTTKNGLL
jgi:hypothetical protein